MVLGYLSAEGGGLMDTYTLFQKFIYWIGLPFVLISYLCEPLADDVHIYLGAAKIQALTGGFPMVLDTVWESRIIGHRFLYYILNLISAPFPGWWYSIWMKSVVAIVTIIILYYFSKRIADRMVVPFEYVFILGFLGLFAVNNVIIFSSEILSVVISMLMVTMLLDDRRGVQVLSGLLVLPLLTLKGLPVLLVLIGMMVVMMLVTDYIDRFKRAIISLPVVGTALLALYLYFPHFISDIFLIRMTNHPKSGEIVVILYRFFFMGIGTVGMVPVIMAGVCSMFLLLSIVMKEHIRDMRLLIGAWLVASVYVVIIGEFWYYHYYLMLIPALFTILYFLKLYPSHRQVFTAIVLFVLILFVTIVAGWSPGMGSILYNDSANRVTSIAELPVTADVLNQPTTLYLDEGQISFYFPTHTACRYIDPLPYQRDIPEWSMKSRQEYWDTRSCILNYTGKYIIINPFWFNLTVSTHSEAANKLATEYTIAYPNIFGVPVPEGNNTWDIYQRIPA
jgi:hypothetical protein